MKAFSLFNRHILIGILLVCATVFQAWQWADSSNGNSRADDNKVSGTVFTNRDCGCFIRYVDGDLDRAFLPVNLDKKFCREGQKIRFSFEYVDTLDVRLPDACPDLIPVKVFNVEKAVQSAKTSFP